MLETAGEISGRQPETVHSAVRQFAHHDAALALWPPEASSSARRRLGYVAEKARRRVLFSQVSGGLPKSIVYRRFSACTIFRHVPSAYFWRSLARCLSVAGANPLWDSGLKDDAMLICGECTEKSDVECEVSSGLSPGEQAGSALSSTGRGVSFGGSPVSGLWTYSTEGCYLYEHVFLLTTWKAAFSKGLWLLP